MSFVWLLSCLLLPAPQRAEPQALDSAVVEVAVFAGSASVKRRAELPPGSKRCRSARSSRCTWVLIPD